MERALYENIGFRILSGDQQPGYWALNDFRRRHMAALGDIFVQTVRLAKQAGLVSMKQVAVDGTKIKANASKNKAMSYKRMVEEEQRLRAEIDDWFKEADRIDAEEDRLYGDRRGDELPEHLNTAAKRLAAIQKAKAELEEEDETCEEEYTLPNDLNIFPLVEKFTVRYHSTDMQYWAGVVMRNLCRKDDTRGGIRQCAYYQCGKWEEYTRQFAKCRRCRRTKYCSKECQKSAWAYHRHWCIAATQ